MLIIFELLYFTNLMISEPGSMIDRTKHIYHEPGSISDRTKI